MKKLVKSLVSAVLAWQIRRLCKKRDFKVVAVAGSIGKTSTKLAIAKTLKAMFKVQYQEGNYNDVVTVPLVFFGLDQPPVFNPVAWFRTFVEIEARLRRPYPYEVVVLELGTDYPGNLAKFKKFVKADVGVLTAITPEHMEFFSGLDAVAAEELTIAQMADKLVVNKDLVPKKYLAGIDVHETYGGPGSDPQRYSLAAAAVVGQVMGMGEADIKAGLQSVATAPGRGQRLKGVKGTVIIDDTYNASPDAVIAALELLYKEDAPHRVAILGNMNELGQFSEQAHKNVGMHCDPSKVDLVVTIGPDAEKYLAPAAREAGCDVATFDNPYLAADYIKSKLKDGSLILAKGSQNGVFAEEAVKLLLAKPADSAKLVRQSASWLKIKRQQFGPVPSGSNQ